MVTPEHLLVCSAHLPHITRSRVRRAEPRRGASAAEGASRSLLPWALARAPGPWHVRPPLSSRPPPLRRARGGGGGTVTRTSQLPCPPQHSAVQLLTPGTAPQQTRALSHRGILRVRGISAALRSFFSASLSCPFPCFLFIVSKYVFYFGEIRSSRKTAPGSIVCSLSALGKFILGVQNNYRVCRV